MDSVNSGLRVFEIPETLDWRSLLRPPGPDYVNFLDASLADDPETWSESDVFNALEVLKQTNFKNVGDCLNILTPDLFNTVFSLNRCYSNLEKQNQILLCQFLSTMCSKVHFVLESIPPKPYTSDKDASDNHVYKEFVSKIACFTSSSSEEHGLYQGLDDSLGDKMGELSVGPKTLGILLRSLINASVFLICMCYKFVATLQKNEEGSGFELKDKHKRGRKSKKDENTSKSNTMAIENIVDGLLACCKYNFKYPYSSDYGGSNRPSIPTLRMLFQTLLNTLSLDEKVHPVSNNMVQSIAKIIKINFSTMQSNKINHYSFNSNLNIKSENSEETSPDIYGLSSGNSSVERITASQDLPNNMDSNVEDLGVDNIMSNEYDDEWLSMLVDEIKKPQCVVIVDVLEIIKDSNIPNIIVNELFINIKENYSSQISNSNQLISSLVQNEFTNIGLFFEKMAKKVPCVVLSNINQLKQLFDVPCYPLRKSIMEAIKLLIILSKYYDTTMGGNETPSIDGVMDNMVDIENLDDKWMTNKKDDYKYKLKTSKLCCRNREMLLNIIISRQFDVYMYARACVLKVLYDLVESDALPVRKYNLVVSFATARLMDKGSQVRQKALALVSLIVDVVTNTKFLLALDTDRLNYELKIVESNIKKVNFLLSEHSIRKYNINTSSRRSRSKDKDSPKGSSRIRSRRESLDFVDVHEYDYDLVLLELKCDFGKDVLNKLDELHNKLELAKELYNDALEISERVDTCLKLSLKLLRSPTETDQKAAIKFISSCHLLGLEKATKMLPQVWSLSWSNSQSVVESVLLEFKNVYFQNVSSPNGLHECSNLLINLINTGDLTCLSSVEKMFQINQNKQQLLNINLNQLIIPLIKIATTSSLDSGKKVDNNNTLNNNKEDNENKDLMRCKTTLNLIKIILSSSQNHNCTHDHMGNNNMNNNTNSNNKENNTLHNNKEDNNSKVLNNENQNNLNGDSMKKDREEFEWDMSIFTNILLKYNEDILLEVCQILIYVKKDEKVQDFVQQILKMFLNYFGSTNFNWFQIAQIVIDLSFTHLYNPLSLWSSIIKELLSQLISEPSALELTDLTQQSQLSQLSQSSHVSNHPEVYENVDRDFHNKIFSSQNPESSKSAEVRKLSHLIFITGHVSIRSIIYIEKVQNDLKVARSNMNEEQVENNMGLATKDEMEREFFDNIIENKLVNDNLLGGPMFNIIVEALVNPQQFIHPEGNVHSHNFFDNINYDMLKNNGHMKNNKDYKKNKNNDHKLNGNKDNHNNKNMNNDALVDSNKEDSIFSDGENEYSDNNNKDYTVCLVQDDNEGGGETCLECNILFICSVISLCKYATVSKKFCNIKLVNNMTIIQIIISLLLYSNSDNNNSNNKENNTLLHNNKEDNENNILNVLKCNLLICYGDLLVRHPNVMEPMNDFVFRLLSYPVIKVRETAILVFSHLVMNDMIKPKGKLLDNIMFLTQDTNEKISNYAKVFLNEIHRKNPNTIYNCFPEMLSTLSQPSTAYVNIISNLDFVDSETSLQENYELQGIKTNLKILNEIFNFIKNDKQEHLVEKICIRLNKAKTIFATTIYINALLLVNYDEKNIIKLSKSLNLLRQLLSESQPLLAALCIIHKRIKSTKGPKVQGQIDIKEIADEMMNKIKNILGQGKATMLMRASQFSEQIIELLNNGNYSSTNLRSLFDREKERKENMIRVKKEDDESSESSNTGDYLSSSEDLGNDNNNSNEEDNMYSSQSELKPVKKEKYNKEDEDNLFGDDEYDNNKEDKDDNNKNKRSKIKKNVDKIKKSSNKVNTRGRKRRNIAYEESEDDDENEEDSDLENKMELDKEENVKEENVRRSRRKLPERTKKNKFNVLESYIYNDSDESEEDFIDDEEDDYKNNTKSKTNRGRTKRAKR